MLLVTPILALDLGATTGWAARDSAGAIRSGSVRLAKTTAKQGARLNGLSERLSEWHSRFLPELYVYEQPFIRDGVQITARPLVQYEGMVLAWCDRVKVEAVAQDPELAKKAMGRASLGKDDMMRIAGMMGYPVADHNQADALGHLFWRIGVLSQTALALEQPRRRKVKC